MKTIPVLCLGLFTAVAAFAADVAPVFNATLTVGKESRFVLLGANGTASRWLNVGDTFEGWKIASYDPKAGALDLQRDGRTMRVALAADAAVGNGPGATASITPATIQDATALLDSMHFEEMMDKTMAGVKKQQLAIVEKMMGQSMKAGADRDALIAFQKKVIDEMMSAITGADMKDDVAKVYSEVFSKEQLQSLANFYASPLGQSFSDKQPELAEKMNQVMMPRIMAMMPKIQQMTQQFKADMRAKAAAAPALPAGETASAAPAPVPAPKP